MDQSILERPQSTRVSTRILLVMDGSAPGECSRPTAVCIIHKRPPRWIGVGGVYVCRRHQSIQINKRRHRQRDTEVRHTHVDALEEWCNRWLLRIHPQKCKVMTVTRHTEPEQRSYTMKKTVNGIDEDHTVDRVKLEKDLGLAVDTRLTFEQHISDKVNKANKPNLRRSFIYMDYDNFRWLYKAIVRPHLEYINSVWNPMRQKDINQHDRNCAAKSDEDGETTFLYGTSY